MSRRRRLIELWAHERGEAAENWRRSTFYRLVADRRIDAARRISAEAVAEFPTLAPRARRGHDGLP